MSYGWRSPSPLEKFGDSTLFHFLPDTQFLVPRCPSGLTSRVKPRVVGRVASHGHTGRAQWQSGLRLDPGSLVRAPRLGARVRAAQGLPPPLGPRTRLLCSPARDAAPPAPCSLCGSCQPPEGANKRQPVVCPVTIYQLSAPQGSAAATRAQKVQHAGSFGRARRLARRGGPG